MSDQPRVTEFIAPPINTFLSEPHDLEQHERNVAAAASEAAQREAATLEASNRGSAATQQRPPPPPNLLDLAVLPEDHAKRIAKLDEEIYSRGIAVDRAALISLGRSRFQQLLADECEARTEHRAIESLTDLTDFGSVLSAFVSIGALQNIPVPRRKTAEQLYGVNADLDQVRQVHDWHDLWKFFAVEPRAVTKIYRFRRGFESLIFATSMLERVGDDGRMRSKFFCGGKGARTRYFEDWLTALKGDHFLVRLKDTLQSVIFWLSSERSPLLDIRALAKDWYGRAPSHDEITLTSAILEGYLLGYKDWLLWRFVGEKTRRVSDKALVDRRRQELRERFPKVDRLHNELAAFFWQPKGDHREFESGSYRQFLDRTVEDLRDLVSQVTVLAIEETPITARFQDWLLCSDKSKSVTAETITSKLGAAFRGARFQVTTEETH